MCGVSEHKIYRRDFFLIRSVRVRIMLIKRCPNLRVLVWDTAKSVMIGRILAEHCPRIEHVDGLNDVAYMAMLNVNTAVKCVRSRCGVERALALQPKVFGVSAMSYGVADIRYISYFNGPCTAVEEVYWPNFNLDAGRLRELLVKLPNVRSIRSKGMSIVKLSRVHARCQLH